MIISYCVNRVTLILFKAPVVIGLMSISLFSGVISFEKCLAWDIDAGFAGSDCTSVIDDASKFRINNIYVSYQDPDTGQTISGTYDVLFEWDKEKWVLRPVAVYVSDGNSSSSAASGTGDTTETDSGTQYIGGPSVEGGTPQGGSNTSGASCTDQSYASAHPSECYQAQSNNDAGGHSECKFALGHPNYCYICGPCDEGQGGCNSDRHCKAGLVCDTIDYATQHGRTEGTYTCIRPD